MSSFAEVYPRIQQALSTRTQSELAKVLGVRQSSISDAKRRGAVPSGWYLTLFEKCGLSQDWLRYGAGPMYLRTEQGYVPRELPAEGAQEESVYYGDPAAKSAIVTVYSMHRAHGGDGRALELATVGKLAIPSSFTGPNTLVLLMQSANMSPTVRSGAYIGVDTLDTQPTSGGIFVLKDDRLGLLVRRVFLDYGERVSCLLRSDDGQHPESMLQPEDFVVRAMGRVNWVIQEIA